MNAGPEEIAEAVRRLSSGGLVAFPTETVYGLGADAMSEAAVRQVFAVKGRPPENPLIVHVSDARMARGVVEGWSAEAQRLADAFWPGPLTLVLPKAIGVPSVVTGGGPMVAVRSPDHALTLAMIETFGRPVVGPSANPSGGVSPTTAEHVRASFTPEQVFVLDGGPCRGGIESTVVSLLGRPRVLRPGLVSAVEIGRVLGAAVEEGEPGRVDGGSSGSPGRMAQHYAPRSPAVLYQPEEWERVEEMLGGAEGPGVVVTHARREVAPPHRVIRMPEEAEAYATRLYGALREADAMSPSVIAVESPPRGEPGTRSWAVWMAVRDRLIRATTPME
jgi:L-threonylcarbamoyladenylate synthase